MNKMTFSANLPDERKPTAYIAKPHRWKGMTVPFIVYRAHNGTWRNLFSDGNSSTVANISFYNLEDDFEPVYGPLTITLHP